MAILGFLRWGRGDDDERERAGLAARIERRCAGIAKERIDAVACYAGLLLRVAHADVHLSAAERSALPRLLAERAGVSELEAGVIADLAVEAREIGDLDYAVLTRTFNELADVGEKERLVDCLYAVATADDSISHVEDEEIRAVARALLLSHAQFIAIRSRYKRKIAVMKSL